MSDEESEQPNKRKRPNEEEVKDQKERTVISRKDARHEHAAPVSGSAADRPGSSSGETLPWPKWRETVPPSDESMWTRKDIQVNDYLHSVYKAGEIINLSNESKKFKDVTNPVQGRNLYNLIFDNKFYRTLEVGLAMGASAVWMCQAHKNVGNPDSLHVAIDPNQTSQYNNIGRLLVERAGLKDFLQVMEMTSYRAMPRLLEDILTKKMRRFHLIYIDGWHTFDYTLVDFFYADLLLEVNGIIVLDDILHSPVKKVLDYIVTNWPHYQLVPRTPAYDPRNPKLKSSQATFIKRAEDTREWNAHSNF